MEFPFLFCALDIKNENKDIITASSRDLAGARLITTSSPREVEEYRLHDYLPLDKSRGRSSRRRYGCGEVEAL
jgi:hypothetical protein